MTRDIPGPDDDATRDLGAALRAEVPSEGPTFWTQVDAGFAAIAANPDLSGTPIDIGSSAGSSLASQGFLTRHKMAIWPLAVAAAIVVISGLFVGNRLFTSNDGTVEAGYAGEESSVNAAELAGPFMNFDHWHSVYGVWDCTANNGAGDWVPAFQSDRDDLGIHSHQDGLIHIHPFFERSAGANARLGLWAEAMGITIADDAITLDTGRVLVEGETCGPQGEPAVIHLRRWVLDMQVVADPSTPPTVITTNLADERFYNDREVWTIAYAPLDAEIPLPPAERFDAMRNSVAVFDPADLPADISPGIRLGDSSPPPTPPVQFDLESTIKEQLQQLPAAVGSTDQAVVPVPDADSYGQLVPLISGLDARIKLETLVADTNQELVPTATDGATTDITDNVLHLGAASTDGLSHEIYLYSAVGDQTSDTPPNCWAVVDTINRLSSYPVPMVGCQPDAGLGWGGVFGSDPSQASGYAVLTGIELAGVWFRVELDDGRTVIANTANGVSFVAWTGQAEVIGAAVLDVDLTEIWSD